MHSPVLDVALRAYWVLAFCSIGGAAFLMLVVLPMACFPRTRRWSASAMISLAWLFGLTLWFLSVAVTFAAWGWLGLILGGIGGIVGVVPLAILAAFFYGQGIGVGLGIIGMCGIVWVTARGGVALGQRAEKAGRMPGLGLQRARLRFHT